MQREQPAAGQHKTIRRCWMRSTATLSRQQNRSARNRLLACDRPSACDRSTRDRTACRLVFAIVRSIALSLSDQLSATGLFSSVVLMPALADHYRYPGYKLICLSETLMFTKGMGALISKEGVTINDNDLIPQRVAKCELVASIYNQCYFILDLQLNFMSICLLSRGSQLNK